MYRRRIVVAISAVEDGHLPFVQQHLDRKMIVIDPAEVISGTSLSFAFVNNRSQVIYRGEMLTNVVGVWYRKPTQLTPELVPVAPGQINYCLDGLRKHRDLLPAHFDKATWVSPYEAIFRASNKALQLRLAASLDMQVPDTIFTTSPEQARQFIDSHDITIVKALSAWGMEVNGVQKAFFARKIRSGDTLSLEGLNLVPTIFQAAVETARDIRVNVVGTGVFAASITGSEINSEHGVVRDWRIGHLRGDMVIEPYNLPTEIADRCVALNRLLGLRFGAYDLVVDRNGGHWFLEVNPNGQWAFVEEATGQPIGKAIARLLEGHSRPQIRRFGSSPL